MKLDFNMLPGTNCNFTARICHQENTAPRRCFSSKAIPKLRPFAIRGLYGVEKCSNSLCDKPPCLWLLAFATYRFPHSAKGKPLIKSVWAFLALQYGGMISSRCLAPLLCACWHPCIWTWRALGSNICKILEACLDLCLDLSHRRALQDHTADKKTLPRRHLFCVPNNPLGKTKQAALLPLNQTLATNQVEETLQSKPGELNAAANGSNVSQSHVEWRKVEHTSCPN